MESVLNSSAGLIYDLCRLDHITNALASFHVPERIKYKNALLAVRALRVEAPYYLSDELVRVCDVSSRRRLRPSSPSQLTVPRY